MKQYVGFVCIDDNINPYYKVHCVLISFLLYQKSYYRFGEKELTNVNLRRHKVNLVPGIFTNYLFISIY